MAGDDERDVVGPQPPPPTVLSGDLQAAYYDFVYWANQLDATWKANQTAKEEYQKAVARFTKLSTERAG